MEHKYKSKLLTAVPIRVAPKGVKYVYLAAKKPLFLKDLKKSKITDSNLILNGVKGVSMSAKIFDIFWGVNLTIPFKEFMKLNNVEKIDYKDYNDLLKDTAKFLNRVQHGEMVSGSLQTVISIVGSVLEDMDPEDLLGRESREFPYAWDNSKTIREMLVNTTFDSVNELVWFIMMYLERKWKNWSLLDSKKIDKLERLIKTSVKKQMEYNTHSYSDEQELVLLDHRLVIPAGTKIEHLNLNQEENGAKLLEKLSKFGIEI